MSVSRKQDRIPKRAATFARAVAIVWCLFLSEAPAGCYRAGEDDNYCEQKNENNLLDAAAKDSEGQDPDDSGYLDSGDSTTGDPDTSDTVKTEPPMDSDTGLPLRDTDDPCYQQERTDLRALFQESCDVQQYFSTISIILDEIGKVSNVKVDATPTVIKYVDELVACYMDLLGDDPLYPCLAGYEVVVYP